MSVSATEKIRELLDGWLNKRLEAASYDWVQARCLSVRSGNVKDLYLGFGLVSRKVPKVELTLNSEEIAEAKNARPGWQLVGWSLHDAARTLLIPEYVPDTVDAFVTVLDRLFAAGEVHELVALYQALPVFPHPERHANRAGEGIRSNMQSLFRAVAHQNPYPSEQLDEGMWNQMVLKCLFVEAPLYPVVGLDSRINAALSQMLCDYAHERWAASRSVHPELWRCVRPELTPGAIDDLKRVLDQGNDLEKQAAGLSLAQSSSGESRELLEKFPELLKQIDAGLLSWQTVYQSLGR